jgi:hypothetical protein
MAEVLLPLRRTKARNRIHRHSVDAS